MKSCKSRLDRNSVSSPSINSPHCIRFVFIHVPAVDECPLAYPLQMERASIKYQIGDAAALINSRPHVPVRMGGCPFVRIPQVVSPRKEESGVFQQGDVLRNVHIAPDLDVRICWRTENRMVGFGRHISTLETGDHRPEVLSVDHHNLDFAEAAQRAASYEKEPRGIKKPWRASTKSRPVFRSMMRAGTPTNAPSPRPSLSGNFQPDGADWSPQAPFNPPIHFHPRAAEPLRPTNSATPSVSRHTTVSSPANASRNSPGFSAYRGECPSVKRT